MRGASRPASAARSDRCGRSGPTRRTGRLRRIPGSRLGPLAAAATRYGVVDGPEDLLESIWRNPSMSGASMMSFREPPTCNGTATPPPPMARLRTSAGCSQPPTERLAYQRRGRRNAPDPGPTPAPTAEGMHPSPAATAGRAGVRTDQTREDRSRRRGTARPGGPTPFGRRAGSPATGWSAPPFRSPPCPASAKRIFTPSASRIARSIAIGPPFGRASSRERLRRLDSRRPVRIACSCRIFCGERSANPASWHGIRPPVVEVARGGLRLP